jgi:hypothetical protein
MTPFLTEFVFVSVIAAMLLLLAGLNTIAKYAARRRLKKTQTRNTPSYTPAGAKIITLPKNAMNPPKERFLVKGYASEEEIV